jgi:hypothetical protein
MLEIIPFTKGLEIIQIKRGFKIFFFACIILIPLILFVTDSAFLSCWDFRNNLWGPTYLLTHGQSPYRVDKLFELGNAVWMPMVVGLFFPLGFLTLQQASNLWFMFNLICILLIVWMSSGSRRPPMLLFAVAIFLSLLFPPMISHLWLGQISIFVTLVFMGIAIWNDSMPLPLLGALMAASLPKPQLTIFVLPGFLIYRIKKYGVQKTIQLLASFVGCIVALTLPLFLAYPNWIPDFILELQKNPSWDHPSSLNFLRNAMPGFGTAIWIILALTLFIINIRLWMTLSNRHAIYWSLALTLLITPYIWTWDFVMILPLFISSLFEAKTRLSLGILLGGYLVCWGLIANLKIHDQVNDSLFGWVPWLLVVIIIVSKHLKLNLTLEEILSSYGLKGKNVKSHL